MIAKRQARVAALGCVLLAFVGLWIGHTLEYLRVWGTAGLVDSMTNPVHAYMLPLAAVLAVLGVLFGLRVYRAWQALNNRLHAAAMGMRRIWRGHAGDIAAARQGPTSPVAGLAAIWLPLAAAQIALYLIQENVEAIARAQPAPGLGAITGIHWAAPFVHLYVSLLLACGVRICQILLHRRTVVVERVEALLRVASRRVRHPLPPALTPAHRCAAAPLDGLGRHLWRRPPPLLLDL
ncbi:MAG: hypothetical protein WCB51_03395 [Candidatus Dormiibacterota bacterium]